MKPEEHMLQRGVFESIKDRKPRKYAIDDAFIEKHWPAPKVVREYEENGMKIKVYEAR